MDIRFAKVTIKLEEGQYMDVFVSNDDQLAGYELHSFENIPTQFANLHAGLSEEFYKLLDAVQDWSDEKIDALNIYLEDMNRDSEAAKVIAGFEAAYKGKFYDKGYFVERYIHDHTDPTTFDYIADALVADQIAAVMFEENGGSLRYYDGHVFELPLWVRCA